MPKARSEIMKMSAIKKDALKRKAINSGEALKSQKPF